MNILILDDDRMILSGLSRFMNMSGMGNVIHEASTSKYAIELLSSMEIDLLLMDGHCPDNCQAGMLALGKGIRVLIMTGDLSYDNPLFTEVLFKPFDLDELEDLITK